MHGLGGALAVGKQEKGKEEMEWRSGKHPVVVWLSWKFVIF
jgi:hypothetical protein